MPKLRTRVKYYSEISVQCNWIVTGQRVSVTESHFTEVMLAGYPDTNVTTHLKYKFSSFTNYLNSICFCFFVCFFRPGL